MKKLKKIIKIAAFEAIPEFLKLRESMESNREQFEQAQQNFHDRRGEYENALRDRETEPAQLFLLRTTAQIAEYQKLIKKLEWRQARHDLKVWAAQNEPPKAEKKKTKGEQAADIEEKKQAKKKKSVDEPAAAAEPKKVKAKSEGDNLKIIEGIGPAIEKLLHAADIRTFKKLSKTNDSDLREILTAAGNRFKVHDPSTWAKQAELADDGKWDKLKSWQAELKAGSAAQNK